MAIVTSKSAQVPPAKRGEPGNKYLSKRPLSHVWGAAHLIKHNVQATGNVCLVGKESHGILGTKGDVVNEEDLLGLQELAHTFIFAFALHVSTSSRHQTSCQAPLHGTQDATACHAWQARDRHVILSASLVVLLICATSAIHSCHKGCCKIFEMLALLHSIQQDRYIYLPISAWNKLPQRLQSFVPMRSMLLCRIKVLACLIVAPCSHAERCLKRMHSVEFQGHESNAPLLSPSGNQGDAHK